MSEGSTNVFRRSALTRNAEPERIDALLRVTAPHEWAIAAGLLLSLLLAATWRIFARVETNLTTAAVLVRPGERSTIVSAVAGSITDVLVKPGDAVAAGAHIATVAPAGLDMRLRIARATEERLADLLDRPGAAAEATLRVALAQAQAQAERVEFTALATAGSAIVSSRAGTITAIPVIAAIRFAAAGPVTAAAFLSTDQARAVQPGMAARLRLERADRRGQMLVAGAVLTVAERGRLPAWLRGTPLAPSGTSGAGGGHLVTFSLQQTEAALPAGDLWPGRLEIVLQRVAPLALLTTARDG